ncbi:MAG: hypothetical protein KA715_03560 [Xanthomonadaceae bacterium]|nr:hypothetical protein [Xanthomonadaceae bacterium]
MKTALMVLTTALALISSPSAQAQVGGFADYNPKFVNKLNQMKNAEIVRRNSLSEVNSYSEVNSFDSCTMNSADQSGCSFKGTRTRPCVSGKLGTFSACVCDTGYSGFNCSIASGTTSTPTTSIYVAPRVTTTTPSSSRGGRGGCFTAETEITMADGSKKAIKDIVKGEKVLSAEGNAQAVAETFVHSDNKFLFAINEGKHFITEGHPIKTKDGWKSISPKKSMEENHKISGDVGQLKVGDVILSDSGEIEVTKIHKKLSNVKVYNLEVENDHSYRANGIFVHNKVYRGDGREMPTLDREAIE